MASPAPAPDDWDDHWDRYEASARENPAQAYRRRVVFRLLEAEGPPRRLLDIGSGQGDLLAEAARRWPGAELAGVELSESGARISRVKVPAATIIQRDLLRPAEPDPSLRGWASHATCSEVLEHVEDPAALLRAASSFMAPECRLVITVPGGPMSEFDRHIGHRTHYTAETARGVIEQAGLRAEREMSAVFPCFKAYQRMVIMRRARLIDDVDGSEDPELPLSARIAMRGFDAAFRLNLDDTRWGTQVVAVARAPGR